MRHLFISAAAVAVAAFASHAAAESRDFGPLLDPPGLEAARSTFDPLILDIRTGTAEGSETSIHAAGHIPGAVHAPYNLFRGPKENAGQLPDDARLTELLRGFGVEKDRPTVVVYEGKNESDFGAAARVYWTLKSSGVSTLAILNGGMKAWNASGLNVETGTVAPVPSDITVTFSSDWLATGDDVVEVVEGKQSAKLIDARTEAFWKGERKHNAALRPGTLPQSSYFTHSSWFSSERPSLIQPGLARQLAAENGFANGDNLVSFCNTGHLAATNWFALSELAGIENVKLYAESMVAWSNAGHGMMNVPGAAKNLWNRLKGQY